MREDNKEKITEECREENIEGEDWRRIQEERIKGMKK